MSTRQLSVRVSMVGLVAFASMLIVPAAFAEAPSCTTLAVPASSSAQQIEVGATNCWGKRNGITCGEQYTGNGNNVTTYCVLCCDEMMSDDCDIDQWNNCISHCNARATGSAVAASTVAVVDDEEINCSNNGDCPDDKKWCTHCRNGKKIPEAEWFCADHDEHQEHERGCNGVAVELFAE